MPPGRRSHAQQNTLVGGDCRDCGVRAQQHCQQQEPAKQASPDSAASQSAAQAPPQSASTPQESLADAARRAREQKKDTAKQAKVFTTTIFPRRAGSQRSARSRPPRRMPRMLRATLRSPTRPQKAMKTNGAARFAKLRHKLEQDQADLEVMQRELGVLELAVLQRSGEGHAAGSDAQRHQRENCEDRSQGKRNRSRQAGHLRRRGRSSQGGRRSGLGSLASFHGANPPCRR